MLQTYLLNLKETCKSKLEHNTHRRISLLKLVEVFMTMFLILQPFQGEVFNVFLVTFKNIFKTDECKFNVGR